MDRVRLGKKIQSLRIICGYNIKQLAEKIGITSSMLSQIERGIVNPSIDTLRAISKAIEVPLYVFFLDDEADNMIVRANERKSIGRIGSDEVVYQSLTPNNKGAIEFCIMTIPAGKNSDFSPQSHVGEEVAIVLEGEVDIEVADATYSLAAGDSLRLPPMSSHIWHNQSDKPVNVIFAITPPSF